MPGFLAIDAGRLRTGELMGAGRSEVNAELLDSAHTLVRDFLGDKAAAEFDSGTDGQRRELLGEVSWLMLINDTALATLTRDMGRDMRGAVLNALANLSLFDAFDAPGLQEGLRKAFLSKRNEAGPEDADGFVPVNRPSALNTELMMLEAELHQAVRARMLADGQGDDAKRKAEEEHLRVTGKIARAMVLAAREEAGENVDDGDAIEVGRNDEVVFKIKPNGEYVQEPHPTEAL